jgi:hypothetical protein
LEVFCFLDDLLDFCCAYEAEFPNILVHVYMLYSLYPTHY